MTTCDTINQLDSVALFHGWSTYPPGPRTPPRNKGLIAGLIKGNQWLISHDHKALLLGGGYVGYVAPGGRLVD